MGVEYFIRLEKLGVDDARRCIQLPELSVNGNDVEKTARVPRR